MDNFSNERKYLVILLSFILVIGVFFRCYNLEQKVYWHDEVFTSIRTAGYNGEAIVKESFTGEILNPEKLLQYQVLSSKKTWSDTLDKLLEHPEHPPLYYLFSRAWQELFGSSVAATRSLSVFFSLLLFPLVYWLCWELFNSQKVAWWAIAVIAISPVQVLYAQEAREYSLLLVVNALSCTALVGAVKRNNWQWWFFYSVALALNFYVSLIGAYIAIANTVYIIFLEKFKITKITINFILSGLVSLIFFSPWLITIVQNYELLKSKTSWANIELPFLELLSFWELHLSSIFFDFHPKINYAIASRLIFIILFFVMICFYCLYQKSDRQSWLLIFTLISIPAALLIIPDVIQGGQKSIMTRYFLPSILGVQLTVAYWLSQEKLRQPLPKKIVIMLIVSFGIISCAISSQANTWWNKVVGYHNPVIASIINKYEQPLLISNDRDINIGNLISLSYLLDNQVKLRLFKQNQIPVIKDRRFSEVLLWNLSEESLNQFIDKNQCQIEIIAGEYYPPLWLVKF